MLVRDQEILLPTTMVGLLPAPPWLTGKIFGEYDEPDYINYRVKEDFWDAVRLCVDDQAPRGSRRVCDGQQYFESETTHEYGQVFHFWGHHLKGFTRWGDPIAIELYKKFHAPLVVDDIEWVRPVYGAGLEATQFAAAGAPTKIAVQGPLFLTYCCTDRHYGDMKPLAMAIAKAFNAEFRDLAARGSTGSRSTSRSPTTARSRGSSRSSTPRSRASTPTGSGTSATATRAATPGSENRAGRTCSPSRSTPTSTRSTSRPCAAAPAICSTSRACPST